LMARYPDNFHMNDLRDFMLLPVHGNITDTLQPLLHKLISETNNE